jgi:ABC-type sugar transport system ATPase subunit
MTAEGAALLEARGIYKYFGAITALRDVNFHVNAGEVLGVVGDNGAGKSTLMKILAGLYPPSEGTLIFDGRPVHFTSPRDARNMGIEMVYQDFALAGNMPIFENIYLGREPGRKIGGLTIVDHAKSREMAIKHLDNLKIRVKSVEQNVEDLSGGQRQAVAIARATAFAARLVIMDEPTAALGVPEQRKVIALIQSLKAQGKGIIFISHNLGDIFEVADRIVVFRRGKEVGERRPKETTGDEVVRLMVGK